MLRVARVGVSDLPKRVVKLPAASKVRSFPFETPMIMMLL